MRVQTEKIFLALHGFRQILPSYAICGLALISLLYGSEILFNHVSGHSVLGHAPEQSAYHFSMVSAILIPLALVHVFVKDRWLLWGMLTFITAIMTYAGIVSSQIIAALSILGFAVFFAWGRVAHWGQSLRNFLFSIALGFSAGLASLMVLDIQMPVLQDPSQMLFHIQSDMGSSLWDAVLFVVILVFLCPMLWISQRRIMTDFHGYRVVITAVTVSLLAYVTGAPSLRAEADLVWFVYLGLLIALITALVFSFRHAEQKRFEEIDHEHDFPVRVSVVMPCHNGAQFLQQAVASVQAQSFEDWELLIIDDGSRDQSWDLMEKLAQDDERIKLFRHDKAQGAGAARNTGLENAQGRYVAFLDCDDLWVPHKLQRQLEAMADNSAAFSSCHYDVIDETGTVTGAVTPKRQSIGYQRLLKSNDIGCSTAMIDRAYLGLDLRFPQYERAQDFIFWCSILRQGHFCYCIQERLARYRIHQNSRTTNKIQVALNWLRLLKVALNIPFILRFYYLAFYVVLGIVKQLKAR